MRKNALTFIVVLVTAMNTWAQSPVGLVRDSQQPLAAVAANLLHAGNSSLIKTALSNSNDKIPISGTSHRIIVVFPFGPSNPHNSIRHQASALLLPG